MALLTSRTLSTGVTGTDLVHIVITGDTSQNPAGSSYKAEINQIRDYLSDYYVNVSGDTMTGGLVANSGLTANTISQTSYIDFTTGSTNPSAFAGRLFFDSGQKALSYFDIINNTVPIAMGQQLYTRVWNATGVQIDKGKVIAITGTSNSLPSAILAVNNHAPGSDRPIGVAAENIPNGSEGLVLNNGILSGITLNTFSNGDTLYLSDTVPGGYVSSTSSFSSFTARTNEIGYVIQTGTTTGKLYVNINNEDSNLTLTDIERNILEGNVISTGAYEYTGMTINSSTTVNVAPMRGWVVQNTYSFATLPDVTNIYYTGGTGITITNIATADATYVLVNSASTLYQQTTYPTPQQRRENIFLGKVVHPNRTSLLTVNNTVDYDVSPMSSLRDLWSPIKLINQGVLPSFNTGLTFNTSLGSLYGNGIGWTTNQLNPNSVTISAKTSASFFYRTQTGGTSGSVSVIDPTKYDVNGVITSVGTAGSNDATNQRIYLYPTGVINVLYGQTRYGTLTEAIANIDSETFVTYPNAETTAILIGVISVRNDIVDDGQPLTNTNYAKLTLVSKFGESFGGTGGLSTTNLQQAYNNSTEPEILINSTLDGLSIQNGTGNANDVTQLLQGKNTAGTTTSFIRADGMISGITVHATTISATTYQNLPIDVSVTGGTYSAGTATFTNNTGGTFTVNGFYTGFTGNTSASCITDLYVTNVYGCSPITIHDSVQSVGSSSTGITSFAFGGGVSAFGDYSHAEGESTYSLGINSHAEGVGTYTGLFGYNSTSIVSGVITLDSSYGDVTTQFNSFIILDDYNFDSAYGTQVFYINSITFDGTNTIITLTDATVNTTQAHIGSDLYIIPTSSDVYVGGRYSHSEGESNVSVGYASHTEGNGNFSYGTRSHSEGVQTKSFGEGSHSEGRNTTSNGLYSHVEGANTISEGIYSHSEGEGCQSVGEASHSEGRNTISEGTHSHAEGQGTTSTGNYSHSEGNSTDSIGNFSHSEGSGTKSSGDYSHAEGEGCQSLGASSHAEGYSTFSIADYSHSEGDSSSTGQRGYYSSSIVSGVITLDASYGDVSSEFISDVVLDDFLYDNSYSVKVFSFSSVIFDGTNTIITLNDLSVSTTQARIGVLGDISPTGSSLSVGGYYSHAEGRQTISLGPYSHAQGVDNVSIGIGSFSSGRESYSYGEYSFVHSSGSLVYGNRSVVLGGSNITGNTDDTVYVPYLNIRDLATGTSVNNLGVDSQGNVVIGSGSGTLTPPVTLSGSGITVLTLIGSGNTVPVFEIQGSSGQLFKVNDSLIGSLFSVNNISALPVFEVFSDNTILMGDYNSPSLNTTVKLSASTGSTVVYSIPTSAYTGAFFEYTVGSGTNFRAGNITSIWDGSNAQFVDSYTGGGSPEIGSTSDISFSVGINSGNAELLSSATTTNWDVKVIVRSI